MIYDKKAHKKDLQFYKLKVGFLKMLGFVVIP